MKSPPLIALFLALIGGCGFAAPETDTTGFKTTVAPFIEKYCLDCHDNETRKGKLSLEGINASLQGDQLEVWRMIRDQLFFHDMPPEKKKQPTQAELAGVMAWVRGEMLKMQGPASVVEEKLLQPKFGNYIDHDFLFGKRLPQVYPAAPRIWRLRPGIYDAVVPRVAEGVNGLANSLSLADGSDFKDYASAYFIDEASTAPLLGNAKKIAEAMVAPKSRDAVFKELVSEAGAPAANTVASAIQTAFRKIVGRAATADEEQRFLAFHQKALKTGGHVLAGKALLTAVFMQPEVLYRQELGDGKVDASGRMRLAPREIGYALSYALDNKPIPEFLQAAADNKVATSAEVTALVGPRLVDKSVSYEKNPRILQFFREYFDYPNAEEVFKDDPPGGDHEPKALVADLELTIIDILKADKNVLAELLTTRSYYVNAKYGVKENAGKLEPRGGKRGKYQTAFNLPPDWKWTPEQPISFPKDERAGVLTHPAWLAAWSGNFENHPVQRGKWIRTHLLGGSVPDVPIGVDARVPEMDHTTFRDRLKKATNAAECWRCHKSMDPLGVTFERYDHYGRLQRLDAGQPVDASGEISRTMVPAIHGKVTSPVELMEALAKSEYVEQVFVRHAFRYFMGRNETLGDANTLQNAHKAYREKGGSFNELVASLLSSDSFLLRQKPKSQSHP